MEEETYSPPLKKRLKSKTCAFLARREGGGLGEAVWNFFKKNNKQANDPELLLRTLRFLLLF
jgi:hypothetical protein